MTPALHLLTTLGGWVEVDGPWDVVDDGIRNVVDVFLLEGCSVEAPSGITVIYNV